MLSLALTINVVSSYLTPQISTGESNDVFHVKWDNLNKITTNVHGSNIVNSTGGIMIQENQRVYEASLMEYRV